jgi:hypothetical protein
VISKEKSCGCAFWSDVKGKDLERRNRVQSSILKAQSGKKNGKRGEGEAGKKVEIGKLKLAKGKRGECGRVEA